MTERLSNRKAGNIWAGWLLASLAESWPLSKNIEYHEIISETGVSIENKKANILQF
ncbi:hypothetical protein [Rhabdaerophilum sp.]|uniref:hypothetical protein n=1 Tax=Rhabdaerophilum sp. TaxID=2717341 RepID=UPI0038D40BF7